MGNLPVDDVLAKPPSGTLGRYEIVKRLASSGMADLLLARTSSGGAERHIVIKQLREDQAKDAAFVKTFVTEARLASALHHHNIVQIRDVGEDNGKHYVAMEYVHGEDLRTILARLRDRGQMLPVEHLVTIGKSVAAALHHAHEQVGADRKPLGMVHSDVAPTNILVGYDGNVKVVDFGIAKAAIQATKAQVGGLTGKVPYMAPEQCTGQGVDRRSDVFALGIVLYEFATVRRLFKGETDFLTMATIVAGTVPPPSQHHKDIPDELDKIILKALSRSPADRYQTAAELRTALDRFATRAKLVASVTTLADYMKQLFGERLEPWLDDSERTAVSAIDFDDGATGLALPAKAVDPFDIATTTATASDSPIARARRRAITNTPPAIVQVAKKPVALESFMQKPAPEARAKLPKPKANGTPLALPRSNTDRTPEALSRANTDRAPEAPPRANTGEAPAPRPRSNTGEAPAPRPRSNTGEAPAPRPRSNTGEAPAPRPRSNTGEAPAPRPRSNTGEAPAPRPRSNTDGASSKAAGNRLPPPLQTPRSIPVVATPVVPTPVVPTPAAAAPPVAAPPVAAPPVAAPPVAAPPVVTPPVAAPPVVTPPVAAPPIIGVQPVNNQLSTDLDETTSVATPPPSPIAIASSAIRRASEATQVVTPLPSPLGAPVKRAPRAVTPPVIVEPGLAETEPTVAVGANHRKKIVAGLIGGTVVIAVILVVVIGFSSNDVTRATPPVGTEPTAATSPEIKPPPPPPVPEAPRPERTMRNSEPPPSDPSPPEAPRPERTMRNSEPPPSDPSPPEAPRPERTMRNSEPPPTTTNAAAQVPAEPPPSKVSVPPKHAITPPRSETTPSPPATALAPSPPKRASSPSVTHKPVQVAKPVAKPQTKPVKQPAYDPNALFLKKP